MKKKVGDLTIKEFYRICKRVKNCSDECPFCDNDNIIKCTIEAIFYTDVKFDKYLDKEVEVDT